jgi:hypothetical protein
VTILSISHCCFLFFVAEQAAAFTGGAADAIARFNMHDDVYIMWKMLFEVSNYSVSDAVGFAYG